MVWVSDWRDRVEQRRTFTGPGMKVLPTGCGLCQFNSRLFVMNILSAAALRNKVVVNITHTI